MYMMFNLLIDTLVVFWGFLGGGGWKRVFFKTKTVPNTNVSFNFILATLDSSQMFGNNTYGFWNLLLCLKMCKKFKMFIRNGELSMTLVSNIMENNYTSFLPMWPWPSDSLFLCLSWNSAWHLYFFTTLKL